MKHSKFYGLIYIPVLLFGANIQLKSQCLSNSASELGIVPTTVAGNPALCSGGTRFDPPDPATRTVDAFGNTITFNLATESCGQVVSWTASANIIVDHVIVKGGPNANDYDYTATNPRANSDDGLHSPLVSSDKYADVSHIDFCFHYRLTISKTAVTEYTRTYEWDIDKECLDGDLRLAEGQQFDYNYRWTATTTSKDNDWKVSGNVTVANNTPYPAMVSSISDYLNGTQAVPLNCGISFPYMLASGATLNCTYSVDLSGAVNGYNKMTVATTSPKVEGGAAQVEYRFGNPTSLVDECITITDECRSPFKVWYNTSSKSGTFICPVGPYSVCGNYQHTNTISFKTNDLGLTGSANCSFAIEVPCQNGCTLTQGYWKTHSEKGPARYDDTWAQLPNGANTPFFLSGQTYYEVLWTAPAGNAYYNLAHQYIAAQLNMLNGASPTAVMTTFSSATSLLNTYTPTQVAAMKASSTVRKEFINLAGTLDKYNNGIIGPGHCDESTVAKTSRENSQLNLVQNVESVQHNVSIYPNPASTRINIDLTDFLQQDLEIQIFNTQGQLVWRRKFDKVINPNVEINIDEHSFSKGLYQVRIQSEGSVSTEMLIII